MTDKIFSTWSIFVATMSFVITSILVNFEDLQVEVQALIVFMIIDYVSGVLVAIVFKNSNKTETGAYNSSIGFKGLLRKIYTILLLVVLHFADKAVGTDFLMSLGTVGFLINELISIIENAGLMGIKLPKAFTNAIDVLKSREDKDE